MIWFFCDQTLRKRAAGEIGRLGFHEDGPLRPSFLFCIVVTLFQTPVYRSYKRMIAAPSGGIAYCLRCGPFIATDIFFFIHYD
jgi:hypothetical protein